MENRYANLIKDFETNLRKLLSERLLLRKENIQLKQELETKKEDLMQAHKEVLDLRNEIKLLQAASGMGGSADDRKLSRKHLNKMVQEIDKCLTLLNDLSV